MDSHLKNSLDFDFILRSCFRSSPRSELNGYFSVPVFLGLVYSTIVSNIHGKALCMIMRTDCDQKSH